MLPKPVTQRGHHLFFSQTELSMIGRLEGGWPTVGRPIISVTPTRYALAAGWLSHASLACTYGRRDFIYLVVDFHL